MQPLKYIQHIKDDCYSSALNSHQDRDRYIQRNKHLQLCKGRHLWVQQLPKPLIKATIHLICLGMSKKPQNIIYIQNIEIDTNLSIWGSPPRIT